MATSKSYATATPDRNVGTVRTNERKIIVLDIDIDGASVVSDPEAEYQITLNGRNLVRMNHHRAMRALGLQEPW